MGKSTVSQGAEGVEREERKPKSKCFIQFRPYSNYDGEFGFDWMRMGDTKRKGDNWLGKIMGEYYENDNVSIFQNSNTWNNNFVKELKMYDDKLKSYKNFSRYNGAAYLYLIPTLTILKGVKATFDLHFEIKENPNKLTLEFEDKDATKYFSVNKTEITDIRN